MTPETFNESVFMYVARMVIWAFALVMIVSITVSAYNAHRKGKNNDQG